MRTDKQIEASRANGAKSQGPTTPEGKAASSLNATTHGLTSRHPILLKVEQQAAFHNYLTGYITWLKPEGPVETDIVEEMVTIQWRRQRGEAMEATLVQLTMDRMAADVEKQFNNCPHATRIAMAMEHLEEKGKALGNFQRHTLRLSRQFLRLHKSLREIQADRPEVAATAAEPVPAPATQKRTNRTQGRTTPQGSSKYAPAPAPPGPPGPGKHACPRPGSRKESGQVGNQPLPHHGGQHGGDRMRWQLIPECPLADRNSQHGIMRRFPEPRQCAPQE